MSERKGCWLGSGCLTFLAGIVAGASLTILALVGWGLVRSVDRSPLEHRLIPGGADLEVTLSEAFLNQTVAEGLAASEMDERVGIVLDARLGQRLDATIEGRIDLGGVLPPTPKLDAEVSLGAEAGRLIVRIDRVSVGPVFVVREALPEVVQTLFASAEESLELAVNKPIVAEGFAVQEVRTDDRSLTIGLVGR